MAGSRDQPETLPTFTTYRSTGSVPNFAPAASPRVRRSSSSWPPCRALQTAQESPGHPEKVAGRALLSGPHPPGWSRCTSQEALHTGFSRTPSRLASQARVVWQYQPVLSLSGLLPPSPRLPGQAALSFTRPLRRPSDGVLRPPFGNAAPRGARRARFKRWLVPARCCR
jgi:hypothetical protein